MKLALVFILAVSTVFAETTKWGADSANGVSALTDSNFDSFVKEHPHVFVKFFAPWCGHCKSMAESYAALARKYNDSGKEVVIAEVDCTVQKEACAKYKVQGFPTLKFFLYGEAVDYSGAREADEIESWIEKKSSYKLEEITSEDKLVELSKSKLAVVLSGDKFSTATLNAFTALASSFDKISFHFTKLPKARELAKSKSATNFIIFRTFDDGLKVLGTDAEITAPEMRKFFDDHRFAAVIDFDDEAAQTIFGGQKTAIFFFNDNTDSEAEKVFYSVAATKKFKIIFSRSTITSGLGQRLSEYIGVNSKHENEVRLVKFQGQELEKFKLENFTAESLTRFIEDFQEGKLKTYTKSEKPIENDTAPVKTIVGDNFDDLVIENDRYVLLEVYAPWCGHCKQLIPIYDELAKKVAHNKKLVIAKMDGTANEHPSVSIKGFPTIKFYKKDKKSEPLDYAGARDLEGFLTYLKTELGDDWVDAPEVPIDDGL